MFGVNVKNDKYENAVFKIKDLLTSSTIQIK